jgi:hypothetical protein
MLARRAVLAWGRVALALGALAFYTGIVIASAVLAAAMTW